MGTCRTCWDCINTGTRWICMFGVGEDRWVHVREWEGYFYPQDEQDEVFEISREIDDPDNHTCPNHYCAEDIVDE